MFLLINVCLLCCDIIVVVTLVGCGTGPPVSALCVPLTFLHGGRGRTGLWSPHSEAETNFHW